MPRPANPSCQQHCIRLAGRIYFPCSIFTPLPCPLLTSGVTEDGWMAVAGKSVASRLTSGMTEDGSSVGSVVSAASSIVSKNAAGCDGWLTGRLAGGALK